MTDILNRDTITTTNILDLNIITPMYIPWDTPKLPKYKEAKVGKWAISRTPSKKWTCGYFLVKEYQPKGYVIKYDNQNVWMSLTAMEIESHMPHLDAAHGNVVVMGLGMGFALYNIISKPTVTKVTVVEQNPDIVSILEKSANFKTWPGYHKVNLVIGDALKYTPEPNEEVDFLFADIWPHMGDDNALSDTQQMQTNIKAKKVGYWTQEWDYVEYCRKDKFSFSKSNDIETYREFAKINNLPLIEQDNPCYPDLCFAAITLQLAGGEKDPIKKHMLMDRYARFQQSALVKACQSFG